MEKDYCNKCGKCCDNIAVDFSRRVMYRDGIQTLDEKFERMLAVIGKRENITFCRCKYLEDNLCTNSEKPEICSDFPKSPFAFLPEGCGYEGFVFMENERVKQQVRKLKEEILDYSIRVKQEPELQRIIDKHQAFINKYKPYGSENW